MLIVVTGAGLAITEQEDVVSVLGFEIEMVRALGLAALLLVFRLALSLSGVALSAGLSLRVLRSLRSRMGTAYLGASWEAQQAEPSGRLQELMVTFAYQSTHSVKALANWITAWLSLSAFLVAAFLVDAVATLFVFVILAVLGACLYPIRAALRRRSKKEAASGLDFTKSVSELGSLGLEMQVYGVKDGFAERIKNVSDANTQARFRVQVLSEALSPIYMFLAYTGVIAGVTILTWQGAATLASTGAVLLLMLRSLSYGQGIQTHSGSISAAIPYVLKSEEAITKYQGARASGGEKSGTSAAPIELVNVDFTYSSGRNVLHDVSLRIEPNEIVGVIGPSGAGKSTLVQILLGLRQPSRGKVLAGGIDLTDVDRAWWTRQVSMVAQDAHLFTGSVADNIRFFRDGFDDPAINRALSEANLLADIRALDSGMDTHLGEKGGQLSGGQRQRLSIARALVGRPELLILDEPTSALDVRSESLVRESLLALRGSATVVIVAHRMSTLDICDRIMVVEDGRLTGLGTPDQLLATNDFYRNALSMSGINATIDES